MEKELVIKELNKSFPTKDGDLQVLKDINLTISKGEFISIVGHSGCGKSTLLNIIASLTDYSEGSVKIDGTDLKNSNTSRCMIFQNHNLLPWMTVSENIAFGLEKNKDNDQKVKDIIKLVHLDGFENAYPKEISGGMAQRTAIARAIIRKPEILLLDEPFGALDALTRIEMQKEVANIRKQENSTMILVTHDIEEAVFLSDRIIVVTNRPASIKRVFNVKLSQNRRRSDSDFVGLKSEIFKELFDDEKGYEIEYLI